MSECSFSYWYRLAFGSAEPGLVREVALERAAMGLNVQFGPVEFIRAVSSRRGSLELFKPMKLLRPVRLSRRAQVLRRWFTLRMRSYGPLRNDKQRNPYGGLLSRESFEARFKEQPGTRVVPVRCLGALLSPLSFRMKLGLGRGERIVVDHHRASVGFPQSMERRGAAGFSGLFEPTKSALKFRLSASRVGLRYASEAGYRLQGAARQSLFRFAVLTPLRANTPTQHLGEGEPSKLLETIELSRSPGSIRGEGHLKLVVASLFSREEMRRRRNVSDDFYRSRSAGAAFGW